MSEAAQPLPEDFDWALEEPIAVMGRGKSVAKHPELKRVAWEKRSEFIHQRYQSVDKLNWAVALERDIELFGRVVRDILKLEQATPGRPGPRPSLDVYDSIRRMQQFLGHDFTLLPFHEVVPILGRGMSGRQLAQKCDLDRNTIQRLLAREIEPDGFHMRMIADAFGKHPSFFVEWRILYITAAVVRRLEWSPDATIGIFRRLDHQRKLS